MPLHKINTSTVLTRRALKKVFNDILGTIYCFMLLWLFIWPIMRAVTWMVFASILTHGSVFPCRNGNKNEWVLVLH